MFGNQLGPDVCLVWTRGGYMATPLKAAVVGGFGGAPFPVRIGLSGDLTAVECRSSIAVLGAD